MKKVQSKNTAVRNAKRKRKLKQRNKNGVTPKSQTSFDWGSSTISKAISSYYKMW